MSTFDFNPDFPDATDDQKLEQVRIWRNVQLSRCDWTVLQDSPLTAEKTAEWVVYRQQLRDLPDTINLDNPVIPDPPTP